MAQETTLLTVRNGEGRIIQQESYNEPLPHILYRCDIFNQRLDNMVQHAFTYPCWHPFRIRGIA